MTNANSRLSLVGGLILIGLGVLFLAQQYFRLSILDWLWPLFVIGAGVLFFAGMFVGGKSAGALAIPGAIITVIGLILFILNWTHYWQAWAYAWALIIFSVGLGVTIAGWWGGRPGIRQGGFSTMRVGLILFILFGAGFELLIFHPASWAWPVLLIAAGVYLLVRRSGLLGARRPPPAGPASSATVEATARPSDDPARPA